MAQNFGVYIPSTLTFKSFRHVEHLVQRWTW